LKRAAAVALGALAWAAPATTAAAAPAPATAAPAPARACPRVPLPPPIDRPASAVRIDGYLRAVGRASPVVTTAVAGRSVQGRPLRYAVISALPAARLRAGLARLRAVRTGRAPDPGGAPAVVWVAGSVHGNEPSGADADLRLLHELAARCNDPLLRRVTVVVLPDQNPDGRTAHTRVNAAGFDLNRDWLALTQPETRAQLGALLALPPLVYADQHEQGGTTFSAPPYAAPRFHELPDAALTAERELLGPAVRRALARIGAATTPSAGFDLLYPGYGDSATTLLFAASGMTLEAGADRPYRARVQDHLAAARAIVTAVGRHRTALLRAWARSFAVAGAQGARGALQHRPGQRVRGYALEPGPQTAALVRTLLTQGVVVRQLAAPADVTAFHRYGAPPGDAPATLAAGTSLVPAAQPLKHWVQALLGEDPLAGGASSDVGAWSRPLLMGVAGGVIRSPPPAAAAALLPPADGTPRPLAGQAIALLADPEALRPVRPGGDQPNQGTSWARLVLADHLGAQVDVVDDAALAAGALAGHGALVVADGSAARLSPAALAAIAAFVQGGGTYLGWRMRGIEVARGAGLTAATVAADASGSRLPGVAVTVGDTIVVDADDPVLVGGPVAATYGAVVSGWSAGSPAGRAAIVREPAGLGRVELFAFDPTFRASTEGAEGLIVAALG
jgi:zinc carboxypeptidase